MGDRNPLGSAEVSFSGGYPDDTPVPMGLESLHGASVDDRCDEKRCPAHAAEHPQGKDACESWLTFIRQSDAVHSARRQVGCGSPDIHEQPRRTDNREYLAEPAKDLDGLSPGEIFPAYRSWSGKQWQDGGGGRGHALPGEGVL